MWAKQDCRPARYLSRKGNGNHYTFRIWGHLNSVQNLRNYSTKINHLILRCSYTSFKLLLRSRFLSKTPREFLISLLELPNPHKWTPRLFVKLQPAVAVVPVYGFCTLNFILCTEREREREGEREREIASFFSYVTVRSTSAIHIMSITSLPISMP